MRSLILILGFTLLLCSCTKNHESLPAPVASFSFRGIDTAQFKIATFDTCTLFNTSTTGDSISWDLGNGATSKKPKVTVSYDKPGTYTVTLTVFNAQGKKSTISKTVRVLDRVLKRISISNIFWDPSVDNIWPAIDTLTLFIRFYHFDVNSIGTNFLPTSQPIFTSGELHNVPSKKAPATTIPFTQRFVFDNAAVYDRSLAAYLIGRDASGKEYFIISNNESGSSWGFMKNDIANNSFTIMWDFFSSIRLEGDFE